MRPAQRAGDSVGDPAIELARDALARDAPRPDGGWFRRSWEHAPVAVAVVAGAAHTLVHANAAFHQLGAAGGATVADSPAGAVLGRPVAESFAPAGVAALVALLDAVRRGGGPVRGTISAGPAGGPDAWQCTAWPIADAGDEPSGGSGAGDPAPFDAPRPLVLVIDASSHAELARARHRDLTELVLLSALREEARADEADAARVGAEEANAARGRFLAVMSHELRTPLTAIGGYAELIAMGLRGPVTDQQRDALARIQEAMRHLMELTRALLDQATLEAGRVEYVIMDVPVGEALRAAAALVAPQAGAKKVALTVGPCEGGLAARADAAKLRQIVLNLLANAVKFTARGGAVALSCEALAARPDDDAARLAIRVADTGRGIAAAQLAAVFDPYVQVGRRVAARDEGVGLGLAISRDLARGMGGDLTVESEEGVGSTFTLVLPAAG